MNNRFFNAVKQDTTLELMVYDAIGSDFFGEGVTASAVKNALDQNDYSDITVRLNSPGGDAFEGIAIFNLLQQSGKPVNVVVDGLAASAASIIAMSGDTITMNEGTMMMIHPAQALAAGDSKTMRDLADTLDKVTGSIADIYSARTGMGKDEVLGLVNAETWMDADEAVKKGFATAKGTNMKVSNNFNLLSFRFKNVPKELLEVTNNAKTKEVAGEHLTAGDFVYVGNPDDTSTWSLPWHFSTEEKTKSHLRDALARFDQDKVIPKSHRAEAHAKLVRLCKEHGIEVDDKKNDSSVEIELEIERLKVQRQR